MDQVDGDVEADYRVRELEAMVQKLKNENKLLLNKVDNSPPDENGHNSSEEFVFTEQTETQDDDWLYTSPVRPPTKEQKKITPLQWLEQDIIGQKGKSSVNETRQLLTFTLSEDEKFNPNKTPIKGRSGLPHSGKTTDKSESNPLKGTVKQDSSYDKRKSNGDVAQPNTPSPPPMKIKWTPKAYSDSEEEKEPVSTAPTEALGETEQTMSLKVSWDPSKAVATDSEGEEENENIVIPKQWKVKQVKDDDRLSADEQRKVKQVPDDETIDNIIGKWKVKQVTDDDDSLIEDTTGNPQQGKWKVKQIPSAPEVQSIEDEIEEEPTVAPQKQWKVKQVPSSPVVPDEVEEPTVAPQRQWKVKQVPSSPVVPDEVEEPTVAPQRQWKVKQVLSSPVVPDEVEEPTVTPQRQWKVKQVPSSPVVPDEVEEPTVTPQRQWKVKQVASETQIDQQKVHLPPNHTSPSTTQKHTPVQRSGTFTKMQKPKIEQRGLRMVKARPNPSMSSDEDLSRQSPLEGDDEPNFTSYPTLTRPGKDKSPEPSAASITPSKTPSPISRGTSPSTNIHQRGLSPVRHGKSPLEYVRKDSSGGIPRSSRSPSPSYNTPPSSSIRAPSPRRTATAGTTQLPTSATRRQLPSPRQQITPPTKPGNNQFRNPGSSQQMFRPTTQGRGGTASSTRRGSGLTKPSTGHPTQRSIPNSKHIRGGASQRGGRMRQPTKPAETTNDESWLDECY